VKTQEYSKYLILVFLFENTIYSLYDRFGTIMTLTFSRILHGKPSVDLRILFYYIIVHSLFSFYKFKSVSEVRSSCIELNTDIAQTGICYCCNNLEIIDILH